MYFIDSTGGNDSVGLAFSDDALDWKLIPNGPILSGLIDPQPLEGANGYVSAAHVERLPDGRWWMLYSAASAGNAGIGYAWFWDRFHWHKAEINPVFKNGSGPFLGRCYTPSLVRGVDGSLLLCRATNDMTAYQTFVSPLRAPALGRRDLLGPDRLSQGHTARKAYQRGVGTQAERDATIPIPSMGDEWFYTHLAGCGK
uniref:Glycosyl hydrolase family 32 N-terminal domain-containing protein n=1 Tax=Desulfatirhabdium butyrativorans TaxID=340467 RepID=A0A7C4MPJ5_9BACT